MKKIILGTLLSLAALTTPAMAGNWYAGGTVGFMHTSQNDITSNEFSLQPEVGYNTSDKWSFGGQIGYIYRNYAGEDINLNLFNIRPYARFTYFRTSNDLVQLFVDGTVGFGIGSTSVNKESSTACTYEVGLKPGIAINVTEHFSIVANLGFLGYHGANKNAKEGGEPEYGGIRFSSDKLTFGLYYNF